MKVVLRHSRQPKCTHNNPPYALLNGESAYVLGGAYYSRPEWRVLKLARLVRDRRDGRETHYRARPQGLAPLINWMTLYGAFWSDRFDRLETLLRRMDQ